MSIRQTGKRPITCSRGAGGVVLVGLCLYFGCGVASAESLSVLPVNIEVPPGRSNTTIRVINHGDRETSIQTRVLSWKQADGREELTPSDDVAVSPPIVTIAPGASRVLRLALRRAPDGKEATYRLLVDQIPAVADLGQVSIALRLSIPVFARPVACAKAHLEFQVQARDGHAFLVVINDGGGHERVHDIALTGSAGNVLETAADASTYVLAGAAGRWRIDSQGRLPEPGETLHLTGLTDAGAFEQQVLVVAGPGAGPTP